MNDGGMIRKAVNPLEGQPPPKWSGQGRIGETPPILREIQLRRCSFSLMRAALPSRSRR